MCIRDSFISIRNFNTKLVTDVFVVFFCEFWCIFNRHFGDIFTILKDADCHFAGFVSKIIVADGKCCNTTCLADTFFTSDYRNLCRKTDVVDDLSICLLYTSLDFLDMSYDLIDSGK